MFLASWLTWAGAIFQLLTSKAVLSWIAVGCLTASVVQLFYGAARRRELAQRVKRKQVDIQHNISIVRQRVKSSTKSSDELDNIASQTMTELKAELRSGQLKPSDILIAFQSRALALYDQGNSGLCEFLLEANELADSLNQTIDDLLDRSPLAGIPVSIKETLKVTGYDTTHGLAKLCGKPRKEDSVLVEIIKASGGIPFALTSSSVLSYGITGVNPIFGNVSNPINSLHMPGGSSVGEAILACKQTSQIGVGTDTSGSVRIPAAFCGTVALKTTLNRLSNDGVFSIANKTILCIKTSIGLIAPKTENIADFMRSVINPRHFKLDQKVAPLPFNESVYRGDDEKKKKLRIGVYYSLDDDSTIQAVPSVQYAVQQAVDRLKQKGHDLVVFKPPRIDHAFDLLTRCLSAGGVKEFIRDAAYEPIGGALYFRYVFSLLPSCIIWLLGKLVYYSGINYLYFVRHMNGVRNIQQVFDLFRQVKDYRYEFNDAWNEVKIDALIGPVVPNPAPPKSLNLIYALPGLIYCGLYNLIEYPAGSLPMGRVSHASLNYDTRQSTVGDDSSPIRYHSTSETKLRLAEQESIGLPLAVQVIAPAYREEMVLRVMRELESFDSTTTTESN